MLLVDPVVRVILCRCGGMAFWSASPFCVACHHLSFPPGKEDQTSKAVLSWDTSCPLVPGPQPVLLRKGNLTGFTRRKEEKVQTCGFDEVILGLKQTGSAGSPVFPSDEGKEPVNQTQATCTLLQEGASEQ